MLIFRVRLVKVSDGCANLVRIRPSLSHTLLRTAQFTCCNHFHGSRDLLRILYATDLGTNFF